jgi:hypothetical protein
MRLRRTTFVVALMFVAALDRRGEAGSIPWSYQWDTRPIVLDADPYGPHHRPIGGITLTPGAITITGGSTGVARGNANIVAVQLTAFAFAPPPHDQPYRFAHSPYHLWVTLTDVDSGKSGRLGFNGVFEGSFTDQKMDLNNYFTSNKKQSMILGRNVFTVTLDSYTPPAPPSDGAAGSIAAFVSVQPAAAPEPSTLMLAAAGLFWPLISWTRRYRGLLVGCAP